MVNISIVIYGLNFQKVQVFEEFKNPQDSSPKQQHTSMYKRRFQRSKGASVQGYLNADEWHQKIVYVQMIKS